MSCEGCANASSCSSKDKDNCGSNKGIKLLDLAKGSKVKKIIGISSGKGGVGKSFITSYIAKEMAKAGYKVGILDGDILGPSIPRSFGLSDNNQIVSDENGLMIPMESELGIKIMSSNLLLEDETTPIIYRGVLISGILQQFYSETNWGDLDFLFIDMPPGTGDVPLTVYQMIPIDKVIIVTSPQNLVSMIVGKSINMAKTMNKDILGIVENMSYVECPKCKEKIEVFGVSNIDEVADQNMIEVLAKVPLRKEVSELVDCGRIEQVDVKELNSINNKLIDLLKGK